MSEIRKTYEGKLYFITMTVVGWIDVFNRPLYVQELINSVKFCQQNKGLELYCYCIMSSHVHLIARASEGKLSDILRDMKSYTAKKIYKLVSNNLQESRREWMLEQFESFGKQNSQNSKFQFWQQNNHPIELYSNKVIDQKIHYIHNNPVEAGLVKRAEHYPYSSACEESEIQVLLM
jgi:putative transposase